MRDFRHAITRCNFRDLGYHGPKFTWCNKRAGMECVKERLDRALVSMAWNNLFPLARVEHLVCSASDHLPILVDLTGAAVGWGRRRKPFRFQAMWIRSVDCEQIVKAGWGDGGLGSPMFCVNEKIKSTRMHLLSWNKSTFGNVHRQLQLLREQLNSVQHGPVTTNSIEVERHLMQSIDELLAREETMWRQRSRVDWLKGGDRNTAFFHARASPRHKKKLIKGIRDNQGRWIEEENRVEDVVVNYFKNIFSSSQPHITEGDLAGVEQRVTADMNLALMREFQPHEVRDALFQMHPTKAPGPDVTTIIRRKIMLERRGVEELDGEMLWKGRLWRRRRWPGTSSTQYLRSVSPSM